MEKKEKRIEKKLKEELGCDKAGYGNAIRALKKSFSMDGDIQKNYRDIKNLVKKTDGNIAKLVQKKKGIIKKELLDTIKKSLEFCQISQMYMPRTTESILWALFFHKLESLTSMQDKIKAINDCLNQIDSEFRQKDFQNEVALQGFYTKERIDTFKKRIEELEEKGLVNEQITEILVQYDLGIHYLISRIADRSFSPVVGSGQYGYEYKLGKISYTRPDCHETATLDLLGNLWYNSEKECFDDSLFSEEVIKRGQGLQRLRDALKYLYLADSKGIKASEYTCKHKGEEFTSLAKLKSLGKITKEELETLDVSEIPVFYINRPEIKQEFYNIVSELPEVIYCSDILGKGEVFELDSDVKNIITVLNYFYGTSAKNLAQLGDKGFGISTDDRTISFELLGQEQESLEGELQEDQVSEHGTGEIKINVNFHESYNSFDMVLDVGGGHTFLTVPDRERSNIEDDFIKTVLRRSQEVTNNKERYLSIFTLFASGSLEDELVMAQLSFLNLVFYSMILKKHEVKLKVLEHILEKCPQYCDNCQGMINNLMDAIPLNDEELKRRLGFIILGSGIHKREKPFKVKRNKKKDPWNHEKMGKILVSALEDNEYQCIAEKIMSVPEFKRWGQALIFAFERKRYDIALELVNHPHFGLLNFGNESHYYSSEGNEQLGKILVTVLEDEKYKKIASKIMDDPSFDGWAEALRLVIERKRHDIALKLVSHSKCAPVERCGNEDGRHVGQLIEEALGLAFRQRSGSSEESSLEKEWLDVAFGILNDNVCNHFSRGGGVYCSSLEKMGKALVFALACSFDRGLTGSLVPGESSLQGATELGLRDQYKKIALKIMNIPNIRVWSYGLKFAIEQKRNDIILELVNHPNFCNSGKVGANLLISTLRKMRSENKPEYEEIVAKLFKDSGLRWGSALKMALKEKDQEIALKILDHPTCKFDGGYDIISVLRLAIEQGNREILLKVVLHPSFKNCFGDLEGSLIQLGILRELSTYVNKSMSKCSSHLPDNVSAKTDVLSRESSGDLVDKQDVCPKQGCQGQYKKVVLKIMDLFMCCNGIMRFDYSNYMQVNYYKLGNILKLVLQKGYSNIALDLLANPKEKDWGYVLKVALEILRQIQELDKVASIERLGTPQGGTKQEASPELERSYDLALAIVKNPKIDNFGYILKLVLETGHSDLALALIENPAFTMKTESDDMLQALELALEYKDILFKILQHPTFDKWKKIVFMALDKGDFNLASEIINHPACNRKRAILEKLLEQEQQEVLLKIVSDLAFEINMPCIEHVLVSALQKGYKNVAEAIMSNPKFKAWASTILCVLYEENNREITAAIINHPKCNVGISEVERRKIRESFLKALKLEYNDIVLAMIEKFGHTSLDLEYAFSDALWENKNVALAMVRDFTWGKDFMAYALEESLDFKYSRVALEIVNKDSFNADFKKVKSVFKTALKKGFYDVILALVKNKGFNVSWDWVQEVLHYIQEILTKENDPERQQKLQEIIKTIKAKQVEMMSAHAQTHMQLLSNL